jgi:hypothetical protein
MVSVGTRNFDTEVCMQSRCKSCNKRIIAAIYDSTTHASKGKKG